MPQKITPYSTNNPRRIIMRVGLITFSLLVLIALGCSSEKHLPPNILFISVDDLRPELGCYGVSQIITPNMDRLAKEGAVFLNSYANVPVCGASRASLLTGLRPAGKVTLRGYKCRSDASAAEFKTLPEYLKQNGYYTISNGKMMHVQDDTPQAWSEPAWRASTNRDASIHFYNTYDDWVNPNSGNYLKPFGKKEVGPFYESADVADEAYHDGQVCIKTIDDIKRLAKSDKPFFLACGFWRPHLPFNAPKNYWELYDRDKINLANNRFKPKNLTNLHSSQELLNQYAANEGFPTDENFHRLSKHAYYASVSYIDALVGKLMQALKENGLEENTIVVLWGDHGFHLGEHNLWGKHNMMNVSLKAPLLIKYPGKAGLRLTQLTDFIDIYPTLCEMVNLPIPEHCEGKSLQNIIENPTMEHKDALFMAYGNKYSIKTKQYLYTAQMTKDSSFTKIMLFDHKRDPQENINVLANPDYKSVVDQLHKKLYSTLFEK